MVEHIFIAPIYKASYNTHPLKVVKESIDSPSETAELTGCFGKPGKNQETVSPLPWEA